VSWQEVFLLRLSVDQADPVGLLRAAFVDAQGHPVRDILLAWLMSLAPGVDPAHAARAMLPEGKPLPGSIGDELAEIARWPADRLRHLARERRRRAF
jgi:hypothetical protein